MRVSTRHLPWQSDAYVGCCCTLRAATLRGISAGAHTKPAFTSFAASGIVLAAGAPRADILAVCSYARVMRGPTVKVTASLRTCATVMGYKNPAPLLPLLLQLTTPTETDESTAEATPTGLSKRPHAYLLLPAEQLASRAVQLQQLYGLSREQLAKLARQFPQTVFAKSSSTTKLKALLLQLQLLGDGSCAAGDRLAPDIQKLFKKCPQVCALSRTKGQGPS